MHVEFMTRGTHDNDNDPTWTSIGLAAALILNRLQNQKQIDSAHEDAGHAEEDNREQVGGKLPIRLAR